MMTTQLNPTLAHAVHGLWTVTTVGGVTYQATLRRNPDAKGWIVSVVDTRTGAAVLLAHPLTTPNYGDVAWVLDRRARDLNGGKPELLGVDFNEYRDYAAECRDKEVKNPQRFIITESPRGEFWAGTIADLLRFDNHYQRAYDYLRYSGLLAEPDEDDDDYPQMSDIYAAMTREALQAACDADFVYVTDLYGDVLGTLDTLQATIEGWDGTEREVALAHHSFMIAQLVVDTGSAKRVASVTGLSEEDVLERVKRARAK
ncbi:MAG: hypothetical protein Q4D87_05685 [Actinomycetaceae bacterium]|nr:hypothetical protein [Actinomycetaceae bacterium]